MEGELEAARGRVAELESDMDLQVGCSLLPLQTCSVREVLCPRDS